MEFDTDYKRWTWKIEAKLFKMRKKRWRSSFNWRICVRDGTYWKDRPLFHDFFSIFFSCDINLACVVLIPIGIIRPQGYSRVKRLEMLVVKFELRWLTTLLMDYNSPTSNSFEKCSKTFLFLTVNCYLSLLPFCLKLERLNFNKWPKWTTEYLRRDWALVG